jgi:hypothetical protein
MSLTTTLAVPVSVENALVPPVLVEFSLEARLLVDAVPAV